MAEGHFDESLKCAVCHDIIFSFLGKKASPDLIGFVRDEYGIKDYIAVEVKRVRTLEKTGAIRIEAQRILVMYSEKLRRMTWISDKSRMHEPR